MGNVGGWRLGKWGTEWKLRKVKSISTFQPQLRTVVQPEGSRGAPTGLVTIGYSYTARSLMGLRVYT